ncbi:hypothetical protein RRG08_023794 [Elysia crispata]|uniref:Uncharacterized protein n=1 Tax=Elysia crispata TaxID=231223 RepID=A0AAE0ZXJ1_9GAST|nr:hypothetical protein RRG08_023794 [Elysia crispata]
MSVSDAFKTRLQDKKRSSTLVKCSAIVVSFWIWTCDATDCHIPAHIDDIETTAQSRFEHFSSRHGQCNMFEILNSAPAEELGLAPNSLRHLLVAQFRHVVNHERLTPNQAVGQGQFYLRSNTSGM